MIEHNEVEASVVKTTTEEIGGLKWYVLYDSFEEPVALMWKEDRKKEAISLYIMDREMFWEC